jgi:hypothetical protein
MKWKISNEMNDEWKTMKGVVSLIDDLKVIAFRQRFSSGGENWHCAFANRSNLIVSVSLSMKYTF